MLCKIITSLCTTRTLHTCAATHLAASLHKTQEQNHSERQARASDPASRISTFAFAATEHPTQTQQQKGHMRGTQRVLHSACCMSRTLPATRYAADSKHCHVVARCRARGITPAALQALRPALVQRCASPEQASLLLQPPSRRGAHHLQCDLLSRRAARLLRHEHTVCAAALHCDHDSKRRHRLVVGWMRFLAG